jgi:hypothetical protein
LCVPSQAQRTLDFYWLRCPTPASAPCGVGECNCGATRITSETYYTKLVHRACLSWPTHPKPCSPSVLRIVGVLTAPEPVVLISISRVAVDPKTMAYASAQAPMFRDIGAAPQPAVKECCQLRLPHQQGWWPALDSLISFGGQGLSPPGLSSALGSGFSVAVGGQPHSPLPSSDSHQLRYPPSS